MVAAAGQDAFDLKAWGTDRIYQDCGLLESLMGVSPRAFLSRYGTEARYDVRGDKKGPSYLRMLYLLPEGVDAPSGYASVTLPAGTYVQANYRGPWGGVRQAYDRVGAWAVEHKLPLEGPWYEFCRFSALDHVPSSDVYRCGVSLLVGPSREC